MLRRKRSTQPDEPKPTGDPYHDVGTDPAFKQRRLRGWVLAGALAVTVPTLWVLAMSQGFKMNRQAPPSEDLVRQGASDYGCGLSRVWYTWDSDNPDTRGTALKLYNPAWDSRKGWNGQGKQSAVYTTSPITKKVEGKDREYDVTCGVFFSDPAIAPVFDTVRVLAGENYGEYSVLSVPAPVSNPAVPVPGQEYKDEATVRDIQAQPNVSTPVTAQIRAYMDAWGKGDRTVLQALVTGDMTTAPLSGGLVLASPNDASDIKIYQTKDGSRTYADVKVRWSNTSGAAVEANYRLDFVQKDGRWLVSKVDSIPLDQKAYVSQST